MGFEVPGILFWENLFVDTSVENFSHFIIRSFLSQYTWFL